MPANAGYRIIKVSKDKMERGMLESSTVEAIQSLKEKYFQEECRIYMEKVNEIIKDAPSLLAIEDVKFLKEIRIYNQNKELYIFKRMGKFNYRYREDAESDGENYEEVIESYQFQRYGQNKKIRLRSYINYNQIGQANIYDYRIVEIE